MIVTDYVGRNLLGRYEIQERINIDSIFVVYKAYDNVEDRIVVIKILQEENLDIEKFKSTFKSELIKQLNHINIAHIYDVYFSKNIQYIVMEYIDGITLKEFINKQGSITWNDVIYFSKSILEAVQYAHNKNIIHGNITAENILLTANAEVKIKDFGIYNSNSSQPKYEDIGNIGVLIYEMLTGELFENVQSFQYKISYVQHNIKKIYKKNPDTPLGLEQICFSAVQNETYTAKKFLSDINKIKTNTNTIFKYSMSLRDYLLISPKGYLDCSKTLDLFLPFILSLIENNQTNGVDVCPDNVFYSYSTDSIFLNDPSSLQINEGYSALETHEKAVRDETATVYSIAACIYRTLVGSNPPSAPSRKRNDKLMIPYDIAENIQMCVIKALVKALQLSPDNRTQKLSELFEMLSNNTYINGTDKADYKTYFKSSVSSTKQNNKSASLKTNKNSLFNIFKKQNKTKNFMHNDAKNLYPYQGNKTYIFISYAHKDKKEVFPIINRLLNDGFRVWFDDGIDPGTEWDENIAAHIENCGYFIPFISQNYLNSSNCKDELNFARDLDKDRFLVYLEDVKLPSGMTMRLSRLQNIHKYTYNSLDEFYNKFMTAKGIDDFKS